MRKKKKWGRVHRPLGTSYRSYLHYKTQYIYYSTAILCIKVYAHDVVRHFQTWTGTPRRRNEGERKNENGWGGGWWAELVARQQHQTEEGMNRKKERKKKQHRLPWLRHQPVGSFSFEAHSTRELLLSLSLWLSGSFLHIKRCSSV